MGTSRETGGGRGSAGGARPRPAMPAPAPRRTPRPAMPAPGPNGTYRATAEEFERATGRRAPRRRGNR